MYWYCIYKYIICVSTNFRNNFDAIPSNPSHSDSGPQNFDAAHFHLPIAVNDGPNHGCAVAAGLAPKETWMKPTFG